MQTWNVNTIEFNGRKACINSYSDHPLLVKDMTEQREKFAALYPNATVKTERLSDAETVTLVTASGGCDRQNTVHAIGEASNKAVV